MTRRDTGGPAGAGHTAGWRLCGYAQFVQIHWAVRLMLGTLFCVHLYCGTHFIKPQSPPAILPLTPTAMSRHTHKHTLVQLHVTMKQAARMEEQARLPLVKL